MDDFNWSIEFEASNSITANNTIGSGSGFDNGLGARYDAGSRIRLAPGFRTSYGARFHAQIDGCGGSNPRNGDIAYYDGLPARSEAPLAQASFDAQVYPNPFSDRMNLELLLTVESTVAVSLYTANGQLAKTVWQEARKEAGLHKYQLDGSSLPTGVYFLRIQVNGETEIKPLNLQR